MSLRNDLAAVIQTLTSNGYNISSAFDIGANKGTWTLQYEKLIPRATFHLFEANPTHSRPARLAGRHNWFNAVLSSPQTKEVEFYGIAGTGDSYYKEDTQAYQSCTPITLPTTTLSAIVKEHSLPLPQLIKLDTQGSELDILKGAEDVIEHVDILMTEMAVLPYNKGAPTFDQYMATLTHLGFVPVGVERVHQADNIVIQLDMVFLKTNIKTKYYGATKFWNWSAT